VKEGKTRAGRKLEKTKGKNNTEHITAIFGPRI
jgi:hypothetical protein